ncbi:MAG: molybdopterin-guanine dinucleotide biosynthesis adapter protein [Eubacteriales bacterium]|nr:molybdopterin-guanine dinucleotide biosynthesis adapter protein [Eubacteriales bacterium]MDN5363340.1 molybdopterin-guanine dinucleotide biosynthesis adapter protein [Eubacteriales bacterium]
MRVPVVSIVSQKAKSGKTTLIEKLVHIFKSRNLRVAVVKHTDHEFEIDVPGRDTWRHDRAGADVVVIAGPHRVAVLEKVKQEKKVEEILEQIPPVDIVLVEGYKRGPYPKIQLMTAEEAEKKDLIISPAELIAVVCDRRLSDLPVPCFTFNEARRIADFLQEKFLAR